MVSRKRGLVARLAGPSRCGPTAWGERNIGNCPADGFRRERVEARDMILVFGKSGQVATELQRQAPKPASLTALPRAQADLSEPAVCAVAIGTLKPSVVINAAAYTTVDHAEEEEPLAIRINGEAPGAIARACADLKIPLVHISTDYVFDGSGELPWKPSDPTAPLNAYGRSKLAGEEAIRASGCTHVILRTSWVVSAHGANFVKTMLRLGAQRDWLTIVADQVGGPTPAADIARTCLVIAEALLADPAKSGTYHLSGGPDVSWADFAREIFAQSGLTPEVHDISTKDFPTPAERPRNSRMDNTSLTASFGLPRPDWRTGLHDILTDIGEKTIWIPLPLARASFSPADLAPASTLLRWVFPNSFYLSTTNR